MTGQRKLLLLLAVGAAFAVPAAAYASGGGAYGDYSSDGTINGCDYSGSDLQNAIGSIPTDVAQYDPQFKNALNKALAERAGGCGSGAPPAPTEQQKKAAVTGTDGAPRPPAGDTAGQLSGDSALRADHGFPAALGVLAALVALILGATAVLAYRREREPGYGGRGLFSVFTDYYWGIRDTIGR